MTMSKTLSLSILSSYCWLSKDSLKNTNLPPSSLKIFDVEDIVLNQIPPIKRRRLKGLSKMAMHTSLSCLDKVNFSADKVYTVFASQHGEIGRTTSIVNDIVDGHDVSPKDFSLSVHNSSLGLFSIFNKNNVKEIVAVNKKLDPNLHQAMMEVEDKNKEPGTIVQEIQKGYKTLI